MFNVMCAGCMVVGAGRPIYNTYSVSIEYSKPHVDKPSDHGLLTDTPEVDACFSSTNKQIYK